MPELPEVETVRLGLCPHLCGKSIRQIIIRQSNLRWPVPQDLALKLTDQMLITIERRAKYLLFRFVNGTLLIHLGMSGSLRLLSPKSNQREPHPSNLEPPRKHDHVDFLISDDLLLRYHDPRRFGCILWLDQSDDQHPLLQNLGPEPLSEQFNGEYLFELSRKRKLAVKQLIMNQQIVTGVGNIYANEALFLSGIHPETPAHLIDLNAYSVLANIIKQVLNAAIQQGGTTLRDYINAEGKPGYFKQQLYVYGRAGETCKHCGQVLEEIRLNNRSSVYCGHCQLPRS